MIKRLFIYPTCKDSKYFGILSVNVSEKVARLDYFYKHGKMSFSQYEGNSFQPEMEKVLNKAQKYCAKQEIKLIAY